MKIFWKSRHGAEFRLESGTWEPMERERFYTLAGLAALGMLLVTVLLYEVWR